MSDDKDRDESKWITLSRPKSDKKSTKWLGMRKTNFFFLFLMIAISVWDFSGGVFSAGCGWLVASMWLWLYSSVDEDRETLYNLYTSLWITFTRLKDAMEKLPTRDKDAVKKELECQQDAE